MKQGLKLLSLAVAALLAVSSCSDLKYDAPLLTEPQVEGLTPNITIAELKEQYADVADRTAKEIEYDYVLKGVVVGNDVSGNIYKQIYIQDETGGIAISIDQNELAGTYSVGQEVYIDLHGLAISMYGGQPSIGHPTAYVNRIPNEIAKDKIFLNKWPNADLVTPNVVTIGKLSDKLIGCLVQINGVLFEEAGQPFAISEQTVNRLITDAAGASLIVRNSGYADFAADLLPSGVGTVVGILSKFGNDYQLFLRTHDDVFNFVPGGFPSTPDEPDEPDTPSEEGSVILDAPFTDDFGSFTAFSVSGKQSWFIDNSTYKNGAKMSGFADGKAVPNEDWLISPELDLSGVTSGTVAFSHALNFFDPATKVDHHQLLFSTDYTSGDPSKATWESVKVELPSTGSWKFIDVKVSLPKSVLNKKGVHFAFKYISDEEKGATWEIKGLKVTAAGGGKVISGGSTIEPMG